MDTMSIHWNHRRLSGMSTSTIGVVGGMGPEATNRFCSFVTALTPVRRDQDHIPVIAFSNSAIPSRLDALRGTGVSPVPELIRTARVLEQAGAHFLTIPCNIAHFFIDDIRCGVSLPILNMVEETVNLLVKELTGLSRVGILSSSPTQNLYRGYLAQQGCSLITPNEVDQAAIMSAIYGANGIKCGYTREPAALFTDVSQRMIEAGADVVVAACTEVSVAMLEMEPQFPFVDSMQVLAEAAVEKALSGFGLPREKVQSAY